MLREIYDSLLRLRRCTKGAAALEFAIVGSILILLLGGVVDFGHAWYMQQVVTNASREGARYGVTYRVNDSGVRIAPSAFSPTIPNYVLNNYLANTILPEDAAPTVTAGGTGYTTGTKGAPLEVTVTAKKTWFLVSMVPGIGTEKNLAATTVMLCE